MKISKIKLIDIMCSAIIILIFVLCCVMSDTYAKSEAHYQNIYCEKVGGETEVVLYDRSRVDCLTDEYAIEFDFAKSTKVMEGLSQSLHYSLMTGKAAKLVVIIEKTSQIKHYYRVLNVIKHYKLPVALEYVTESKEIDNIIKQQGN